METKKQSVLDAQKRLTEITKESQRLNNESAKLREIINAESDVTKRVKTFADACIECGTTEDEFNNRFKSYVGISEDNIFYEKAKIVAQALNEGWTPDWKNKDQYKWYPYFIASPFGFDGTDYGGWITYTGAGSRLCYRTSELAEYAGKQFAEFYEKFII